MKKPLLPLALFALFFFQNTGAQTDWIGQLGFDEFPTSGAEYSFQFSARSMPVLVNLAGATRIDSIGGTFDSDLEKVKKITHHLHFLIKTDQNQPGSPENGGDPLAIFNGAKNGGPTGAGSLATLLSACLAAKGIPARVVFLQKKDGADGQRPIVEAWINESQRWAVCDAALDFVPGELGHPLSSVELLKVFYEKNQPYNMIEGSGTSPKKFAKAVRPFLFGFCSALDQRFQEGGAAPGACLFLVPKTAPVSPGNIAACKNEKVLLTHSIGDFYKSPF